MAAMLKLLKKIFSPPTLFAITSAGFSDVGRVRKNNEDCFSILVGNNLFMVADGMGGHHGGEVASRTTVEVMRQHFSKKTVEAMRSSVPEIRHALITGFEKANNAVMALAEADTSLLGMGCTLVMAFIDGATLHTCHVGDARCYLVSNGRILRITTDHTALSETGDIPPNRHVVTRVIGYPFPAPPDLNATALQEGDRILLCSDGLWSMMEDRTICEAVIAAESPEKAVKDLVAIANEAGGDDNITALTIFC